ncbi:MAG: 30S ribosomal protein S10 [Candidatus Berkelbacteria bacterium]|nr:30S ribosomal protein S10 [Candidatus Berkelbacteria bacterium]
MANQAKQRIRIKIRGYDYRILDKSVKHIIDTVERSGAKVIGPIPLPTEIKKMTVLKSTFVHKDARDQFEVRVHKRVLDVVELTNRTIDQLMNIELPAGVDIEIKT